MGRPNIVLTGFMGTGKSTVGKRLAVLLDYEFIDTDTLIENEQGLLVHEIFSQKGELAFREMERLVALKLSRQEALVIATGGRMLLDPENAQALAQTGVVFTLTATAREIYGRVSQPTEVQRPLLDTPDPLARIVSLLNERAQGYGAFSQISTSGKTPETIAQEILSRFTATDKHV